MEYQDFVLFIHGEGGERGYSLDVLESPGGEASGPFALALTSPWFQERLAAVAGIGTSFPTTPPSDSLESAARELGSSLFKALTGERSLYACYHTSLIRAREHGKGLRIRLRCQPSELSSLPWELLFDPELKREHLCLSRETPVVRHLQLGLPLGALDLEPPIRILGMVGASHGLDAAREQRLMADAIEHLTERGMAELVWVDGQGEEALATALRHGPWHIFHFIGHGEFDPVLGESFILLAPESPGGPPRRLSARDLARLLADRLTLRLAVLNSCQGSGNQARDHGSLSSAGEILASRGIPAVLSMQQAISDRAAIELSRSFYDRIAEGEPVEAAISDARKAIKLALGETLEWATPVLHLRAKEGLLLRVDLTRALFRGNRATAEAPGVPRPPSGAGRDARSGLEILRRKVRRFWIEGALAHSLERSLRLDVPSESQAGMVENPWRSVLETSAGSEPIPAERSFGEIFEEVGGSLLVLGEPGSGKTVALLELARDLLTTAECDVERPVPVVFPLSSWAVQQRPLSEWLVDELAVKYFIPKRIGRSWVDESLILPLLDGLDEVREEARAACVRAINRFVEQALLTGVVACCRLKEYLQLPVRLSLHGAIRLLPLGEEQVWAYVRAAGAELAALGHLLETDSGMMLEARSPLMLNLMAQVYRDLPVTELAAAGLTSLAARRRALMALYVERMYRQAGLRRADA
jgi:hypothetical protein